MNILGIANNGYSGACLISNGQIVVAASEERFTRIKAHKSFPNHAIKYLKTHCPAVTHLDDTARPQVVTQKSDPFTHQLLVSWEQESNEPALINTSFNIHEEPIVCTAENALANLEKGVIDLLIFNQDLIVWKKDNNKEMEYLND